MSGEYTEWMNELLLFNATSAISQSYRGERVHWGYSVTFVVFPRQTRLNFNTSTSGADKYPEYIIYIASYSRRYSHDNTPTRETPFQCKSYLPWGFCKSIHFLTIDDNATGIFIQKVTRNQGNRCTKVDFPPTAFNPILFSGICSFRKVCSWYNRRKLTTSRLYETIHNCTTILLVHWLTRITWIFIRIRTSLWE